MLEVSEGAAGYDRTRTVVRGIDLVVHSGELVGVLGANGAGKSTLFRSVMGLCRWQHGTLTFRGQDLRRSSPRARVKAGLGLVPQGHQLFAALSVEENLRAGALSRPGRETSARLDEVYGLFAKLAERRSQRAGTLSGGERALVAVGRALMGKPEFLLLDEPSLGLSAGARQGVFGHLRRLCDTTGLTILLAEQDAASTLQVADAAYGMRNGRIVGWRTTEQIDDGTLTSLYLTGSHGNWGSTDPRPSARRAPGPTHQEATA